MDQYSKTKSSKFQNRKFSALDAGIAHFWSEIRIPHAQICIMTSGNVQIPDSEGFPNRRFFKIQENQ